MITSTQNKIVIYFVLTILLSLLLQIFQESYDFENFVYLAQIIPGLIAVIMMFSFEETGVGSGMIVRRIIPTAKLKPIFLFIALLPLIIFPLSFYVFKISYNPVVNPVELSVFALIWPIIGAFSEELGWRGFLLNKAGTVMHMVFATLLTGVMWFFGRAYLFIDDIFLGITYLFLFVEINFILSYLFFMFNRSILLTFLFHLAYSYMFLFFTAKVHDDERFVFIQIVLFAIPTLIIVLKNKSLFQINRDDDI